MLLLIVLLAWLSMEGIEFTRQWRLRAGATRYRSYASHHKRLIPLVW